jgi:hypothetical protein
MNPEDYVPRTLLDESQRQVNELIELLKISQKQTDEMIELYENSKRNPTNRQRHLINQIIELVKNGTITEPFSTKNFKFLKNSPAFLSKHAVGNPGHYNEYFIRVMRGRYKLKISL